MRSFENGTTQSMTELDNNAAERVLRPIALGRKNFFSAGSEIGGHGRHTDQDRQARWYRSASQVHNMQGRWVPPQQYLNRSTPFGVRPARSSAARCGL